MQRKEPRASHNDILPDQHFIEEAGRLISPYVHETPVLQCQALNSISGADLFFKCENFQKVGAFKYRGATHALLRLDADSKRRGVATHSSGNHAQALALAAAVHGTKAYIVMPENSPRVKVDAVRAYGGQITFCAPKLQARESTLKKLIEETGAEEIHPYNNYHIIAGQATAAAELFRVLQDLQFVVAPVGGGGLLSGTILSAKYFSPTTKVIGAEPLMANDTWQSFQKKEFVPSVDPATIADGLRTSLGGLTFPIIMQGADNILTATEAGIIKAMMLIWERMKIIVEPSAAVPLAVILEHPGIFAGKRAGIILSGGNVDLHALPWMESN